MLREPLLHFAVLGAMVLAIGAWRSGPSPANADRTIEVPEAEIEARFERRAGRAPSADEAAALIEQWVDEEALYREALALGLDRDDPVIRGRLVEKMRFLVAGPDREPDEAALSAWLAERADRYAVPRRTSLVQVFVRGGPGAPERVRSLHEDLEAGVDPATLGDPLAHPRRLALRSDPWLETRFGAEFTERLAEAPAGRWTAVRSSLGWHLVRVDERLDGRAARLDEARASVRRDLLAADRDTARRSGIDKVRARYRLKP